MLFPVLGALSKMETISNNGITWNYKVNGDELTMTTPTGQSYTAKMDGSAGPRSKGIRGSIWCR